MAKNWRTIPAEPYEDPHFEPTHRWEGYGSHFQATAQQAAERGWFFRSEWYKRLVPDTRRCFNCGEQLFDERTLTEEEIGLLYRFQDNGMASGPLG